MSVERAARVKIGRPGSIVERNQDVAEAIIEDVSTTGCFVRGDFSTGIGSVLAIGVPGIGTHAAKVMRLTAQGAGCAFLIPINEDEVRAVRTAEIDDAAGTRKSNGFVQMKDSIRSAAHASQDREVDAPPPKLVRRLLGAIRASR
jgi:hypothetical protein